MGSLPREVNIGMGYWRMSRSSPRLGLDSQASPHPASPTTLAWSAHSFLPESQSWGKRQWRKGTENETQLYTQNDPYLDWILVQRHWLPQTTPKTQKSVFPRVPQSMNSLESPVCYVKTWLQNQINFRNTKLSKVKQILLQDFSEPLFYFF